MDTTEEKIRITNVHYLNSCPYRAVSRSPFVEYREADPSENARDLHEGETDLACIPLAEFAIHGGYHALDLGIVADGTVQSVVLVAEDDITDLHTVFLDPASQTSVMLLRLLLRKIAPQAAARIQFTRLAPEHSVQRVGRGVGALMIGDKAMLLGQGLRHRFDLATLWKQITGKPFVFAIWAGRPKVGVEQAKLLKEAYQLFRYGLEKREVFAREWADEHKSDRATAVSYVLQNIKYEMTAEAFDGARLFFQMGQEAGFFPAHGELLAGRFFSFLDRARWAGKAQDVKRPESNRPEAIRQNGNGIKRSKKELDQILTDAAQGKRISLDDGERLGLEASLADLGLAAHARREQLQPEKEVSYIIDRNINYTNVCNVYCRFCAFYEAPGKPGGYLLTREEIGQKIEEMLHEGGVQILLQGGLNPELGITYYEDLFRWIKERYPVNLHALSADEIWHISRVSQLSIEQVLERLIAAGLGSLPGGGAEILTRSVRRRIARLKTTAEEWLEVHRVAHRLGLSSTCTMMFGVGESWRDRICHLHKLRQLQDETKGFTAFISWSFQDENTKLKRSDTSAPEYLRVQAISRLFLDNIPNIQSSWVTQGPAVGQVALYFGANDFGSVMFEENVVSSAGTTYHMNVNFLERNIREAGFSPWRRDVHYHRL